MLRQWKSESGPKPELPTEAARGLAIWVGGARRFVTRRDSSPVPDGRHRSSQRRHRAEITSESRESRRSRRYHRRLHDQTAFAIYTTYTFTSLRANL